jgi:hypothetical protein
MTPSQRHVSVSVFRKTGSFTTIRARQASHERRHTEPKHAPPRIALFPRGNQR